MSRIGRLPITIPAGVNVNIKDNVVTVKGPKGELKQSFPESLDVKNEEGKIVVAPKTEDKQFDAIHGTIRALLNNMVTGVSQGFTDVLEIEGVGYRPELDGKNLVLYVGYSAPKTVVPPEGITFEVDTKARLIRVLGCDRQQVGQVAANIRFIRPPEPYKGKGIHYLGERIRRKAGKAGKAAAKK